MSASVNSTPAERLPVVAVLLATHNGAAFIEAQLASLAQQTGVVVRLCWGDDASADGTPERVRAAVAAHGLTLRAVAVSGGSAARSFLSLVAQVGLEADYFAFCDQDDVWYADKLAVAVRQLGASALAEPRLYCARTLYVDAYLQPLGPSPCWRYPPSLQGALAQNIAAGNTVVMNRAAFSLLKRVADLESPAHDWTAYLAVCAAGGTCVFDPVPRLAYRQHGGNVVGAGTGLRNRVRRILAGFNGGYARWNRLNLAMLAQLGDAVPPPQRAIVTAFATACQGRSPWRRAIALGRSGVRRMTAFSQGLFFLAACLGRL